MRLGTMICLGLLVFSPFAFGVPPATGALPAFGSDPGRAFADAKKHKKPLLISFFGIWCPPCNELEETVFESRPFLEKARAFTLLKVDADAKSSWKLKDRYQVGGYPTVVFASPAGKEIYRVVGYRSPKEFLKVMDLVLSAKGQDLDQACKSQDGEALWRCAVVCGERKDKACAESAFHKLETKLPPGSPRYEQARTYFVENAESADLKRDGYERLLSEFNLSPQAVVWTFGYLELLDGKTAKRKKPVLERLLSQMPTILNDPSLEEFGLTRSDVLQAKAMLLERLDKSDEAKQTWKSLASELEQAAAQLPKGSAARGFTLERISALASSDELPAAMKLADEYRNRFPGEFTFHYLAATLRERQKQYNDAIPVAKRAYELSYGDNRIRVATLLVRLYATVPDRKSAESVRDEVLREIKPDPALKVRTADYLKKLDEAWALVPKS